MSPTNESEAHVPVASAEDYEDEFESSEFGELGVGDAALEEGVEIEPVPGYEASVPEAAPVEELAPAEEEDLDDIWMADLAEEDVGLEVLIGEDDRVRITNTTAFPWRSVCSLVITTKDGMRYVGTGWLVGPRTVITAGHCVYVHKRGGWARSIEVIPGRNGPGHDPPVRPFESCVSSDFRAVKGWIESKNPSCDYAAIMLPEDCAYGDRLGYFGYANLSDARLYRLGVNLPGYPADKKGAERGTQWFHAKFIKTVEPTIIKYDIDTFGGNSGGPVYRIKAGRRYVVGVHTTGKLSGNSAVRITKPVYKNIKKWKAEGA